MTTLSFVLLILFSPPVTISEYEEVCLEELNLLRQSVYAHPLEIDSKLTKKCKRYAKKLAHTGRFIHDPRLRYDIGENIAMSTGDPENPIEMWRVSKRGHREAMLDNRYKYVGIGTATNGKEWYYVLRLK